MLMTNTSHMDSIATFIQSLLTQLKCLSWPTTTPSNFMNMPPKASLCSKQSGCTATSSNSLCYLASIIVQIISLFWMTEGGMRSGKWMAGFSSYRTISKSNLSIYNSTRYTHITINKHSSVMKYITSRYLTQEGAFFSMKDRKSWC